MKTKHIITLLMFCLMPVVLLAGGNKEKKYQFGLRSAIITGGLQLSEINPAFDNLSSDGLKGAHHSSIYFLRSIKPWLRVGLETLTGNSKVNAETSMDFQGAGLLLDFIFGEKFFVAGGVHAGGIIVDAVHKETAASGENVETGTFYKSEGVFLAPYAAIGINIKASEFRFFVKPVFMTSAEKANNLDGFNSTSVGLSYGLNF